MPTPATNDTDYDCYIKAVELVYSIIWVQIMPLVNSSLGVGTYTCIQTFTYRSNFKKPGVRLV